MQTAIADFMIHINENLSEPDMVTLADSICDNVCVTSACVSQSDPHLIMVNYDSNCSSAHAIVQGISGVHAQAVGL
jgi:hypothetical protein